MCLYSATASDAYRLGDAVVGQEYRVTLIDGPPGADHRSAGLVRIGSRFDIACVNEETLFGIVSLPDHLASLVDHVNPAESHCALFRPGRIAGPRERATPDRICFATGAQLPLDQLLGAELIMLDNDRRARLSAAPFTARTLVDA